MMLYVGLYENWKIRLQQGFFVAADVQAKLHDAYYVDNAITKNEYDDLLRMSNECARPDYKPTKTLKELEEQNKELEKQNILLKQLIEKLTTLLDQQVAVNRQQDDMIIEIIEANEKMEVL